MLPACQIQKVQNAVDQTELGIVNECPRQANCRSADNFDFFALTDGDAFVGFMVVQTHKDLAYLFFLAIDPSCRAKGYGSRAVETLRALYPGKTQVVDFEMLDSEAPNNEQRIKRRQFYLRNGYKETGLFLSYLGVDYEVFAWGRILNRKNSRI